MLARPLCSGGLIRFEAPCNLITHGLQEHLQTHANPYHKLYGNKVCPHLNDLSFLSIVIQRLDIKKTLTITQTGCKANDICFKFVPGQHPEYQIGAIKLLIES